MERAFAPTRYNLKRQHTRSCTARVALVRSEQNDAVPTAGCQGCHSQMCQSDAQDRYRQPLVGIVEGSKKPRLCLPNHPGRDASTITGAFLDCERQFRSREPRSRLSLSGPFRTFGEWASGCRDGRRGGEAGTVPCAVAERPDRHQGWRKNAVPSALAPLYLLAVRREDAPLRSRGAVVSGGLMGVWQESVCGRYAHATRGGYGAGHSTTDSAALTRTYSRRQSKRDNRQRMGRGAC